MMTMMIKVVGRSLRNSVRSMHYSSSEINEPTLPLDLENPDDEKQEEILHHVLDFLIEVPVPGWDGSRLILLLRQPVSIGRISSDSYRLCGFQRPPEILPSTYIT